MKSNTHNWIEIPAEITTLIPQKLTDISWCNDEYPSYVFGPLFHLNLWDPSPSIRRGADKSNTDDLYTKYRLWIAEEDGHPYRDVEHRYLVTLNDCTQHVEFLATNSLESVLDFIEEHWNEDTPLGPNESEKKLINGWIE